MEYLDERYPERPLLPADRVVRAQARCLVYRFDDVLGDDYYAFRRGDPNDLAARSTCWRSDSSALRGRSPMSRG